MKPEFREIKVETYDMTVWLLWGCTAEEAAQFVRSVGYEKYTGHSGDYIGLTVQWKRHVVIALHEWMRTAYGISVLAHECFHATEMILDRCSIEHCNDTTEVWAWLLDSLVRRCLEVLP